MKEGNTNLPLRNYFLLHVPRSRRNFTSFTAYRGGGDTFNLLKDNKTKNDKKSNIITRGPLKRFHVSSYIISQFKLKIMRRIRNTLIAIQLQANECE